ncbi:MAG: glycoside hydrolase family 99-like domain-containing protein [Clostridia bacterium]|nr:glycoside hydrolase family 99-like domain-containing protein [Clostridia bacterium]
MHNYDIAAYIWPAYTKTDPRTDIFWPEGMGEWQSVKNSVCKYPGHTWPRKPLWGYVDEADPYVMEMQIEAAVDHGVNVFIYDWYWFDDRPFLETCLNDGFLKAKNNRKMKFYLMWANHDANTVWDIRNSTKDTVIWRGAVTPEQFRKIGRRWLEQYFCLPNYYTIDGKPVVSIYDLQNLILGLGGVENTRRELAALLEEAIRRGLPGIHYQFIKWGDHPINLSGVDGGARALPMPLVEALGFSSFTNYQYVHFTDIDRTYKEVIPDVLKEWDKNRGMSSLPYFPHVSIGWDNNPRYQGFHPGVLKENSPEMVKAALEKAKEFADRWNTVPLITINSWNEWTESSYLQPDDRTGYGYLQAVKDVFGSAHD